MVDQDSTKSIPSLARELWVADAANHCTVHKDPRYISYDFWDCNFLSDSTKEKSLENAKKMLNWLKHPEEGKTLMSFSDKRMFDQYQESNKMNDR